MIPDWCAHRLVVSAVTIAAGVAAIPATVSAAEFALTADDVMPRLMSTYDVPGAAVAAIKDGAVVLARGYGFRDLAARAPVTAATLFNIGSISKSFTALGIAQLVDQHRVDLDAPVIGYLPELRLGDGRAAPAVTLRRLLSHTSGFPADGQWPQQVPPTRDGIVSEFAAMPITAPPGARFQYCSRCIVLAAYVLEHITGRSWEDYTRTQIFAPLGMEAAAFGPRGLEQAPDHGQPYRHDDDLGEVPVPWGRLQYLDPLGPAGGIDANIGDMARYALLQLGDGTAAGRRLVSAPMLAQLHRPEIAVGTDWTPAARAQNLHYALGWFTADIGNLHLVYHNGDNPGFRARIVLAPSLRAGVVVLTNGESGDFTEAASRALLQQLLP